MLGDRLTIHSALSPEEVSARLGEALGREGLILDPKDDDRVFSGRADQRGFHLRPRRTFLGRRRPTLYGSIRADPAGGSIIRAYYPSDLWLRVSVVGVALAFWAAFETRLGTAEVLFMASLLAFILGSSQLNKGGLREFLVGMITVRPPPRLYGERRST